MKRFSLFLAMVTMCLASMAQDLVFKPSRLQQQAPAKAAMARAAATVDEHGIITAPPTGEERTYNRTGSIIVPVGFDIQIGETSGETKMVFCEDGTVYMHHPLYNGLERCGFSAESWVKGVRANGLITFAAGQPIAWSNYRRVPVIFGMGDFDMSTHDTSWRQGEPVVFRETAGGKVIQLVSEGDTHVMTGFIEQGSGVCLDYVEFGTAFTQVMEEGALTPVTVPETAEKTNFVLTAYDNVLHQTVSYNARLALDGNDAYLGDFAFYAREAWIKGTRDAATGDLTFPSEQFLKEFTPNNLFFYALPQDLQTPDFCNLVLHYDAATGNYEAQEDIVISNDMISMPINARERLQSIILRANSGNGEMIVDQPAGVVNTYNRNGLAIERLGNMVRWVQQEGKTVNIVTAYDGKTVYMLDPISTIEAGVWVKGYKDEQGNLHFPLVQKVAFLGDEEDSYFAYTAAMRREEVDGGYTYVYADEVDEVVFTVDEDGWLELAPMADDDVIADPPMYLYAVVDEVFDWTGYGDAGSVYEPTETIDPSELEADPAPGEKYNGYGIITTPGTGEERTYTRSGKNYAPQTDMAEEGQQSGVLHLVECSNGTVYMQQPLSTYTTAMAATSWIRGKRVGNKLYFHSGQPVNHQDYYDENVLFAVARATSYDGYVMDRNTYAVYEESADGKTLTLVTCPNNSTIVGAFSDDDDMWYGYGDFATVLTYSGSGLTEQAVEPSWRAEKIDYLLQADDFDEGHKGYNAVLAFEGDDVYLGNFCFWADYHYEVSDKMVWVKGKKQADGSLIFPKDQYLYTFSEQGKDWQLFFYGAEEMFENTYATRDFVLDYNAATDTYTSDLDILITFGRVTTSMPRAEQLTNIRLTPQGDDIKPYVIKEQPEGQLYKYTRSGVALGTDGMNVFIEEQSGELELVFSFDGRFVYMHKPIQEIGKSMDSWISGTVDRDGTLHFPMGQWLDWSDDFGYGVRTAACVLVGSGNQGSYYVVPNIAQLTWSLNPETGVYTMDEISGLDYGGFPPRLLHGAYWTNDNTWVGCGDGESVYTPAFKYEGIEAVTTNPANGETYYDFAGRRIQRPVRGAYIHEGRKVLR